MIDNGDKLKEKRQKGGNENTEPRPLVCNLFLLLFFPLLYLLLFILIVSSIHCCSIIVHFLFSSLIEN